MTFDNQTLLLTIGIIIGATIVAKLYPRPILAAVAALLTISFFL